MQNYLFKKSLYFSTIYSAISSIDKLDVSISKLTFCGTKDSFVRLTADEVKLLRDNDDNLLSKYLIYLKYYCGYTKDKKTDFTAKQFLSACGYSTKSNKLLNLIGSYNNLLVRSGLIKIESYRDELGHTRNNYFYI